MVKPGVVFVYDGKVAQVLEYLSNLDLWICIYFDGSYLFLLSTEEIEGGKKKDMKLEYKFYEKNLAPKWLEGDYDLHIEGNRMTMTSKEGKKVEARCHPDDDWRLQVGIDELKERMAEAKKPREIKVGDKVRRIPTRMCVYTVKVINKERGYAIIDRRDYKIPIIAELATLELVEE